MINSFDMLLSSFRMISNFVKKYVKSPVGGEGILMSGLYNRT
jgi:hypothetical protein